MTARRSCLLLALVLAPVIALAQSPDGEATYEAQCAVCHTNPPDEDIPPLDVLRTMDVNGVVRSLTDGNMRIQGQLIEDAERIAVAEFVTGQTYRPAPQVAAGGRCATPARALRFGSASDWNGWGPTPSNTRFSGGLDALGVDDVSNLRLKWAFGVPNVTQSRSQPAVIGDRVFMASDAGTVFALDLQTGCTYWTFEADASVRTAISVGAVETGYAIFFADAEARAYAVDADSGKRLWTRKIDNHRAARVTGSPTLYDGRLYVPTSGVSEETAASMPDYECCTFRGAITVLDAESGDLVWKTYTMPDPEPRGFSTTGKPLYGPAGAAIWSSPTIDPARGVIYAATGNAYADPPQVTSNAIIAFDIDTGEIRWVNQVQPGDIWILGCDPSTGGGARGSNPNCPEEVGPDFDFSASPALTTLDDGRDILVVTQKSGVAYALDPNRNGETIWEYRWGTGSPVGGVWGTGTDGEVAYFAVADQFTDAPGGIHAVDLETGEREWYTAPQPLLCDSGQGCSSAQSAAVTAIPGAVFSGSADGGMRAYSKRNGRVIWTFDTNREFETVNGVMARGGSMDGPGPVVSGKMLLVTSGNGGIVGRPGNVLLAFEVAE
jgi:polyvinyl alcohol dehydrogenase (cytochrome)